MVKEHELLLSAYLTDWLTCWLAKQTNSKEQSSSSEGNNSAASQEIPPHFMEPEAPYCIHKRPPPVPILSLDARVPCSYL